MTYLTERDEFKELQKEGIPLKQCIEDNLSHHATVRMQQRGISSEALLTALCYGERFHWNHGLTLLYLGRRQLTWALEMEPSLRPAVDRLNGIAVITKPCGSVITVYKNKDGPRGIVKKLDAQKRRPNGRCNLLKESQPLPEASWGMAEVVNSGIILGLGGSSQSISERRK